MLVGSLMGTPKKVMERPSKRGMCAACNQFVFLGSNIWFTPVGLRRSCARDQILRLLYVHSCSDDLRLTVEKTRHNYEINYPYEWGRWSIIFEFTHVVENLLCRFAECEHCAKMSVMWP